MAFGGCVVLFLLTTIFGFELVRGNDTISDVIQVRAIPFNYTLYVAFNLVDLEKLKEMATKIIGLSKKDDELLNQ
ncbi:unnamed protein product [Bursaphelenchus xylophilus]|uniref:(pine wood nematode) hypothetical protein n=1 Tax=Bursaphelenchus xylophilus TaxID=6326 RepID=A0A7I8XHA0_BURXY|nr:unnamed protein product [Bursaphelenchus xylophilus]CAG9079330.1 unnamed protein product [Bursaphelenchus xylophilus]